MATGLTFVVLRGAWLRRFMRGMPRRGHYAVALARDATQPELGEENHGGEAME